MEQYGDIGNLLFLLRDYPEDWKQYDGILERWKRKTDYNKIYTGDGWLNYVVATPNAIYRFTLWQKFWLWRAIKNHRKYIVAQRLAQTNQPPTL